jgi:hypothetical protein
VAVYPSFVVTVLKLVACNSQLVTVSSCFKSITRGLAKTNTLNVQKLLTTFLNCAILNYKVTEVFVITAVGFPVTL